MHIKRIEQKDAALNAIPVKTFERARASAKQADKHIAAGETGALMGLPLTLKESTQVAGLPQTAGLPDIKGYTPQQDGLVAHQVFEAGAALLGKTNIPVALGDWQADSPVYGRTNNPWDLNRTPGGSTGGGGAALAAGLTPLEVGSDIGGSVRVPAAYCGCYGHRPSETAIPRSGNFPFADLPNPAFLMGVQGPLARSAYDLELLFDVMAGPDIGESVAWQLHLPPARKSALKDFRIAVMPSVLDVNCAASVAGKLNELVALLEAEGATITQTAPDIDMQQYFQDYARMLNVMVTQGQSREEREEAAANLRLVGDGLAHAQADGFVMDANAYLALVNRRAAAAMAWQQFFTQWDVVIAPITLDAAFEHQSGDFAERSLTVDNESLPYFTNIIYPMLAIFTGLPSTAFPAGLDQNGLPLGLQVVGPYLEDYTCLRFAQLVEQAWGGFRPPPGY